LQHRRYILMVGRLVPENGVHVLLDAYAQLQTEMPLVVVGDAPYEDEYVAGLRRRAGRNVIFTGYLFGEGYRQLLNHAYLFVLASGVGGTHPVLTEAMAAGNCIVVNDHAPNLEVLDDAGLSYDGRAGAVALARVMRRVLDDDALAAELRERAQARARASYSWESVTDAYEALCRDVTRPSARPIAEQETGKP
jgi:glycosyltransferase involved in cell wall biosynthesis